MALNVPQRRHSRVTQACEQCRQKKQRCDGGDKCTSCLLSGVDCQYSVRPPTKADNGTGIVVSTLEQIAEEYRSMRKDMSCKAEDTNAEDTHARLGPMERNQREAYQQRRRPSNSRLPALREAPTVKLVPEQSLGDHRTAVHNLLLWPSVGPLLQDAGVDVDVDYVAKVEDRGLLHTYGCGEGHEEHHGMVPDDGLQSPASGDASSPDAMLLRQESWGGRFAAHAQSMVELRPRRGTAGGLKPDGSLDLDRRTIHTLYETYAEKVHIMQPFLDEARTRVLIDKFASRYRPSRQGARSDNMFAVGGRQADPWAAQGSNDLGGVVIERPTDIEPSPSNAIVLLVLALGKICAHMEDLPAAPLHTQTACNTDVVPGFAYYVEAAKIIGGHLDGNDLIHAQMFLLAGLYKGQLGRVKESMSWIVKAGRAVQTLLDRHKLYNGNYWAADGDVRERHERGQNLITDLRQDLIVLASWTCLQLESDILAEVRFPSSGIENIENFLLMPHGLADEKKYEGLSFPADGDEESYDSIMLFYISQMFLRKRLNQVQRQLYGADCLHKTRAEVQAVLHGHETILDGWRAMSPPGLQWNDKDPPSARILSARLRAKYWGARYVINRLFLDYALHIMRHVKEGRSVEEVALDVHGKPRDKADIHLFEAIKLMGEGAVWAACRRCIEAAMQSTVALDGVPDRLVVTNIHGTAHAQFGNMLVLSAVWQDGFLRELIDQERFQALLKRTIEFLRKLSAISPTCQQDCAILEKIQRVLFGGQ